MPNVIKDVYYNNVVTSDLLKSLIEIYNNSKEYETKSMKKAPGTDAVLDLLESHSVIQVDKIKTCHFYKHEVPYYPHTDFRNDEIQNLVVPLEVEGGPNPSLIVFDQYFEEPSVTWTFRENVNFKVNTGVKGRPCDFNEVKGLTNNPIEKELYNNFLYHYPEKYWFGLSGKAYEFLPGSIIQFDSKKIHCTSAMKCSTKLGLTIRYN
jgi:hypothetical protein